MLSPLSQLSPHHYADLNQRSLYKALVTSIAETAFPPTIVSSVYTVEKPPCTLGILLAMTVASIHISQ